MPIPRFIKITPKRKKLIKKYLDLKVEIRMKDAESCTSHREEYKSIYRNGAPKVDNMPTKELEIEIAAAKKSLA